MMTLEELSAREEIRQAIYRHFRAGDRLDHDLEATACWEDGGFIGGPVNIPTAEATALIYDTMLATNFKATNHYMTNILIEVDGDKAFAEVYAIAWHLLSTDPDALEAVLGRPKLDELGDAASRQLELTLGIRYVMRLEERGDRWKIAKQGLVIEWNRVEESSGIESGGVYDFLTLRPTRDKSDPSYEWMKGSPA